MKFLSDILAKAGLTVDGVVTLNNTATGQTPAANDNSTKLATTAWVRTFVQPYSLPIASASILGGIKVGSGLSIDSGTGVLSVTGGGAASIKSTQTFIATQNQTIFTISGGYTAGLIDVFLNGVYLSPNQTTATNGTTVVLNEAAAAGDIIDVIVVSPIYEGATTTTDQLPEGVVNLYYTNARARAAITLTVNGSSGASSYSSSTGVLNVPTYTLAGLGGIGGSGTTGYVSKFTNSTTIGNSLIYDNGFGIGINTSSPYNSSFYSLDVNGALLVKNVGKAANITLINADPAGGGNNAFVIHTVGGTLTSSYVDIQGYYGASVTGSTTIRLNAAGGNILIGSLIGTGTRMVVASSTGILSAQAIPTISDLSGVPTSRTLTINGVTYDLTANRTWSALPVGGVAGQLLAKVDGTDYNAQWINEAPAASYTSQVKHQVKAGQAITKGQAVYVSSADGTNMIVSKASNATEGTSSKTMGLLESTVSTNGFTNVIAEGLLSGLDTTGANAAGDPVWLGTDGNLIYGLTNKPSAPAHLVFIGVVTRRNANNGEIFVKVQNGFEMNELHDYVESGVQNNFVISYESSTDLYKPKSIATLLGYTPANAARSLTINGTTYDLTADRTWTLTTANISEVTNLYYTDARARAAISVTGSGSYNSSTGVITVTGGVTSVNTLTGAVVLTTTNIAEGTNLYYTDSRVGTYLTNNSYATQTYVNTAVSNLVDAAPGTLDTLNELAAALGDDPNFATTVATSIGTKQAQLNGTGFVKVSGTTVSYDNSTYYLASNPSGYITGISFANVSAKPTTIAGYGITDSLVYTTSTYSNPSWITDLAWSKITGAPAFITGNQNITLSGEVTGSGATSIVTTIANNAVTTAKINNGAVTAAKLATFGAGEGLSWAANTDGASIKFESTGDGGSGSRALSNLVIALTDNGDEGLRVTSDNVELFFVNTNQIQYKGANLATQSYVTSQGYLTGITSLQITNALGYTPYNSSNPSGYITGNQTITLSGDVSGSGTTSISVTVNRLTYQGNYANNDVGTSRGPEGLSLRGVYVNGYPTQYGNILHMKGWGAGQLLIGWSGTDGNHADNYVRSKRDNDSGAWSSWAKVWTDVNLTNLNQLSNGPGYITGYTETDTLASVTARGASTSTNSVFTGGLQARRNQSDNNYTTAALWTESYGGTTTGIAFHISGNVGKFLEMRTNGVLYWENAQVWTSSNLTNLNQLSNGPGYITSSSSITGAASRLSSRDLRVIAPNSENAAELRFGFTSWTNNNNAPWADYLHLRSYSDGSGGSDNLVMFLKSGIGMRIWQQSFGSGTAYSSYVDVLHSSNYSSYAVPLSGGTMTGPLVVSGIDSAVKVQHDGTSTAWRGRIGSFNATADKSSFLGNYTGRPGVFGHNNSLSAWDDLWVNTLGVYGQGNTYLSWFSYVKGNGNDTNYAIWHAGNLTNLNQLSNGPGYITSSATSLTLTGNLTVSSGNTTGGGIILADDGDIVDLNDCYLSLRFSCGVRIFSANRGGSPVITLGNNGAISASSVSAGNITTGVNGNHIVQRDANGYIYANHVNFNTSENENPSISSFITSNGDGWSRKSSLAHVKNSIRGIADGSWAISAAQLGGLSLQQVVRYHSGSDFANGTLVITDINGAATYGDSFVMEVTGKSYGSGPAPFGLLLEGYIYADTFINVGAISYGSWFPGPIRILNYNGNLAFWWPRGSYWNSFSVYVREAGGGSSNRVTSIIDSTEPSVSKKVSVSIIQSLNSSNYNSYAPTLTGGNASGTWGIAITGNAGSVNSRTVGNGKGNIGYFDANGNLYISNPESYSGEVRLGAAWSRGGVYTSGTLSMSTSSGNINFVSNDTTIGGFRWDSSNGTRFIVGLDGNVATPYTLIDANKRPVIYARGNYPVLTLDHTETSNTNHGPTIQFSFNGLDSRQWVIGASGNGSRLDFGMSNAAYSNTNHNPHNGIAGYQGKTVMRMTETGVAIGNLGTYPTINSPNYALEVYGAISSNDIVRTSNFRLAGTLVLSGSGAEIGNSTGTRLTESYGVVWNCGNGATWHHQVINGSSLCGFNAGGGNFGNGNYYGTGDVTAYYSDERLKTKINTITDAIEKIKSLEGFVYVENDLARSLGYTNEKEQAGVSAQQIQAVLPQAVSLAPFDMQGVAETGEVVSKSGENYLTVKYDRIVPLLIEGIKEQQAQIESQKSEIEELKDLVKQLINR